MKRRTALIAALASLIGGGTATSADQSYEITNRHPNDIERVISGPVGVLAGPLDNNTFGRCPAFLIGPGRIISACPYSELAPPAPNKKDAKILGGGGSFMFGGQDGATPRIVPYLQRPNWRDVKFETVDESGARVSLKISMKAVESWGENVFVHSFKTSQQLKVQPGFISNRGPAELEDVLLVRFDKNKVGLDGCHISRQIGDKEALINCSSNEFQPSDEFVISKTDGSLLAVSMRKRNDEIVATLIKPLAVASKSQEVELWAAPRRPGERPAQGDEGAVASNEVYDAACLARTSDGSFGLKTLREFVASEEAQAIGAAICSYYSGQPAACAKTAQEGASLVNKITLSKGSDTIGLISARPGFEICRAMFVGPDRSQTGKASFGGWIQRKPEGNGLRYLISLPQGASERHWLKAKVVIHQVPKGTIQKNKCWADETYAWGCKGPGPCNPLVEGAMAIYKEGEDPFKGHVCKH